MLYRGANGIGCSKFKENISKMFCKMQGCVYEPWPYMQNIYLCWVTRLERECEIITGAVVFCLGLSTEMEKVQGR